MWRYWCVRNAGIIIVQTRRSYRMVINTHCVCGVCIFSRAWVLGSPAVPVRLLKSFSRCKHVH